MKHLIELFPRTYYLILNLHSVYFFEYVIITAFADTMGLKMKRKYGDNSIAIKEFYVILNVCYQIGVFISRSSLRFIKIKRVGILTGLQAFNFILMMINSKYMLIESLWVLCPIFIFVGLMGGGSYVNVLHCILELETLDKTERESAMSLSLFFNDLGILNASILSIILSNSYLKI
jgi:battenin